MDDTLEILVTMAVFALPLIRQIRESRAKGSAQEPFVPIPSTEEAEVLQTPRKYQTFRLQPPPPRAEVGKNKTIPPKMEASPIDDSEFTIRSAKEARGITTWSEILNRKH